VSCSSTWKPPLQDTLTAPDSIPSSVDHHLSLPTHNHGVGLDGSKLRSPYGVLLRSTAVDKDSKVTVTERFECEISLRFYVLETGFSSVGSLWTQHVCHAEPATVYAAAFQDETALIKHHFFKSGCLLSQDCIPDGFLFSVSPSFSGWRASNEEDVSGRCRCQQLGHVENEANSSLPLLPIGEPLLRCCRWH